MLSRLKKRIPFCLSAADWKLDEPAWSGRMKITAKGKMAFIKLEDRNTGTPPGTLLQLDVV